MNYPQNQRRTVGRLAGGFNHKHRTECALNDQQIKELESLRELIIPLRFLIKEERWNSNDYVEHFISNQSGFCVIDITEAPVSKEILYKITKAQNTGLIQDTVFNECANIGDSIPVFQGLPKIHKQKESRLFKVRPIINCKGKPIMVISKIIEKPITALDFRSKFSISNRDPVLRYLQDNQIIPNTTMISLDVVNLYTSLTPSLINRALAFIYDRFCEISRAASQLNIRVFFHLIDLMFHLQVFTFNKRIYLQTSALFMGLPSSAVSAEAVLTYIENHIISMERVFHNTHFLCRSVDDAFLIVNDLYIDDILTHFNGIDPKIQYTLEKETEGDLPFLDICIQKNKGRYITAV